MIRIEIDTHTHTSASTHAYSTLWGKRRLRQKKSG